MTGISVRSVNPIFLRLRERLVHECRLLSPFAGELEADESNFGPRRVRGHRGRGAGRKTIVFGLLKRGDQVYMEIVPNASSAALHAIIRNKASIESIVHTGRWRGYNGLVDLGNARHRRVDHGDNQLALGPNHINGIESFWSHAKHRLARFHGVNKSTYPVHLKETKFRFNRGNDDLYNLLLSILRKDPL